jgi:hypothetical protein
MDFESNDRRPVDYVLVALACLGLLIGVSGVILNSVAAAVAGLFILLFTLLCYAIAQT